MKKLIIAILFLLIIFVPKTTDKAYASDTSDLENDISKNVEEQLDNIDFGELDNILINMTGEQTNLFGASSFRSKIEDIVSGKLTASFGSFWAYICGVLFDNLLGIVPLMAGVIAISILCSFVTQMSPDNKTKGIAGIVYFACFAVIVSIISVSVTYVLKETTYALNLTKTQMEIVFPILLTLMTALGNVVTATTFQPLLSVFAGGIIEIFSSFIIPIFIFCFVFLVIGNMSSSIKLDKFIKFFMSLFKWIVGGIFTIFMAFLAIKGITSASVDGVSIKTAKFALRSYVPILGGYLSEGLNLIVASSMLIKNAVGATGLILVAMTIIGPIIKIMVLSLSLKLVAAIVEPLADNKVSNFVYGVSNCLTILLVTLLAVGFMYVLIIGMLMCSGNVL